MHTGHCFHILMLHFGEHCFVNTAKGHLTDTGTRHHRLTYWSNTNWGSGVQYILNVILFIRYHLFNNFFKLYLWAFCLYLIGQ